MNNIINLQINFNTDQLLKEVNSLPLKKNKSKVWKKIRDETTREFFKESKTWYKYEIKDSSQYKEINRLYKLFKPDTIEVFKQLANSELPRHKDFFFNRNRLNVAVSRAQSVAIILFNPNLLLASANSIHEMKLLNNFCKLLIFRSKY